MPRRSGTQTKQREAITIHASARNRLTGREAKGELNALAIPSYLHITEHL